MYVIEATIRGKKYAGKTVYTDKIEAQTRIVELCKLAKMGKKTKPVLTAIKL